MSFLSFTVLVFNWLLVNVNLKKAKITKNAMKMKLELSKYKQWAKFKTVI